MSRRLRPRRLRTSEMISGTDMSWKIRVSVLRDRNQNSGLSVRW